MSGSVIKYHIEDRLDETKTILNERRGGVVIRIQINLPSSEFPYKWWNWVEKDRGDN